MASYLLDANVFIQAKNQYYGFDFCPAFWSWVERAHTAGTVFSVDQVRAEMVTGNDQLATWVKQRPRSFFRSPTQATVTSLRATSAWATGAGYEAGAVATFLRSADYYLVAQAHAEGHTVVTHEIASRSRKKIKIPDACLALSVPYVNCFDMLRAEQAHFVLGT